MSPHSALARPAALLALTLASCPGSGPDFPQASSGSESSSSADPTTDVTSAGPTTSTSDPSTGSSSGSTTSTTAPPPNCGDGVVDPDEECDDGNQTDTDDCTNSCQNAECGDGIVRAGQEACDDGNQDDTDACTSACEAARCGDGFVQAGTEACDQGAQNSDTAYGPDSCNSMCQPGLRCGDGAVQDAEGEKCDDGTPDNDDLCVACQEVPRRYVFVTSTTYDGKRGSTISVDGLCASIAGPNDIGAPGASWTAWLSDNGSAFTARYTNQTFDGWYVLPTDPPTLVAKGWTGLTSGVLMSAIQVTETGGPPPPPATAWTSTDVTGAANTLTDHCSKWNSNMKVNSGRLGSTDATDVAWTDNGMTAPCDAKHHFYCVEN